MNLLYATVRPGIVKEIIEDGNGTVKLTAPGLFSDEDDPKILPPVYPWPFGHHANSYTCPKVDEEVWVMTFEDNPMQMYWVRKDDWIAEDSLPKNMSDLPLTDEAQNLEVIVNREFEDSKWAILYFSNDDGWMMRRDEDGWINIRKDGSILLKTNFDKRIIDICKDSVALGSEGKADDSAMLYSKWKDFAETLCNGLMTLSSTAAANPYTAPLAAPFQTLSQQLKPKISPVESKHVSIVAN